MPTHRIAFIGCGRRTRQHLIGVQADPRCHVVALVDVKPEAAESMNADASLHAAIYTDHRLMLEREKPEVVFTSLWTPLHPMVITDCVRAGVKAIFSEKPMAPSWGECLDIAKTVEQAGCQLSFCHQRRFAAGNREIRKLLKSGRFGKLLRMDLYANKNLLDCGTHTFDQAMSFMDECPAQWVLAGIDGSKIIRWFDTPAEDQTTGIVVFQNGVRAHVSVGAPGQEQDMELGVRLHGSDGFLEVGWDGDIHRYAIFSDPTWKFPDFPKQELSDQLVAAVRHFIDCLESGEESELSHHHALRAEEIIFAMYQSARLRRRVTLPLTARDNAFHTMLEKGEVTPDQ